ncbi:hypothetical protein AB0M46_16125 [Dactylosporangium sp. NPDC051485]|uniref:hypothetical protein n=1 Tax=Dactylosporangium sp. NPDC051485 TaxID=3154846 RepID=UPI0034215D7D
MSGVYDRYSAISLWNMVAGENLDNNTAHEGAWDQKLKLLTKQIGNLQSLREQVAACWNPEQSAAARTFLGQIDGLLGAMTQASDAATKVHRQYSAVSEALLDAKRQLEPLQKAYSDPKAALKTYIKNSTPLSAALSGLPDDWVPTMGLPDALGNAVMDSHQHHLDQQARAIMESTDRKVDATPMTETRIPEIGRLDDGVAPPPPTHQHDGGTGISSSGGRYLPQPVFDPPAPDARPRPDVGTVPIVLDPGPFLTGTPSPPASPPVLAPPSAPPVASPTGPLVTPPISHVPPVSGWMVQAPSGERVLRPGGLIERPTPPSFRNLASGPGPEPMERSGVVGGSPSRPGSRFDVNGQQLGHPAGPSTRIANRSGVIGQEPRRPAAPRTTSESLRGEERTPAGGWHDRSYEAYARRRPPGDRDKDQQWQVEEGVTPLLESPDISSNHDATPGVIGIDR